MLIEAAEWVGSNGHVDHAGVDRSARSGSVPPSLALCLDSLSPLVEHLHAVEAESTAHVTGAPHPALTAWVAALMAVAPAAPHAYPAGLRRCIVCGAALSTTFRMQRHLEGRRHCLAVAQRHLSEASLDAAKPDAAAAAAAFDRHSTHPLSTCVPEPPDAALDVLQDSLYPPVKMVPK